ncbi:hypothetical protein F5Y15DRAFT_411194 [Xylariaceae sp. FL0016]|nr:hypothetical protein F5Y15DRAFT_411194 [Xylariaceae sp. FL0016]
MVKFVGSDPTGLPLKRKQVAQACARCRRRKKRCVHTEGEPPTEAGDTETHQHGRESSASPQSSPRKSHENPKSDNHVSRFVGDMNPEAIFMEATNLCSRRDVSAPGGLGVWESRKPPRTDSVSSPSLTSPSRQAVQDILRSYIWKHCLPCRPPPADFDVLQRIYLEQMDTLFPILGIHLASSPHDAPSQVLVEQVVSLIAAASPDAACHLRLSPGGPILSRHEFCTSLSHVVQTALEAGLVTDRILQIRLFAALSLYAQSTCAEEADNPALLNSRAVHQMQTLGLQMAIDDGSSKIDMVRTLFCCVWASDRINGALYGRAILIHERDVGWDMDDCIARQSPPFRLFLMIIQLLDQVIDLYRPCNQSKGSTLVELPIFEQMILDAGASRISNSCLALLEIFYHSVAILSSQSPADGSSEALPAPATNSRRSLSADRITHIVGEEFAGQLSYMPIVPYGVSLSLSVSYRKMRHSKIPMFRNRGKQAFRANAELLKSMDDTFWTARTMVAMAEQVLQEMDKAAASLAQESGLSDTSKRPEPIPQGDERALQEGAMDASMPNTLPMDGDWSLYETAPDLDVFGHFDPTFDLGAVDALLEGNLEFGTSLNWFDWQQHWN